MNRPLPTFLRLHASRNGHVWPRCRLSRECHPALTGPTEAVSFERWTERRERLGGAVSAAASWAGRGPSSRRPAPAVPDGEGRRLSVSTDRDGSVTPGASAPMAPMDAPPTLRDLAALARREGGDAAEALLGRVRQLALRYARARLGRFGAEDVAQDVAQEVCMAVHTGLRTYDDRGLPFEAFVYAIAARKVADAQRQLIRGPEAVAEVPDGVELAAGPEQLAWSATRRAARWPSSAPCRRSSRRSSPSGSPSGCPPRRRRPPWA